MQTSTFVFAVPPRAFVSGGAGGIGKAIALRLAGLGAQVAVADLPAALEASDDGGGVDFTRIPMDLRDEASVHAGIALAAERFGGLDTVVNAAGVIRLGRLEDVSAEEWAAILAINLGGTFLVLREAMPHLKASGRGRVVNVASDAGKRGYPLLSAYCASKFAVVGLTQAIAAEVAPDGVRVNAVCPSTIADTAMGESVAAQRIALGQAADMDALARRRIERFPLGRPGSVHDVTEAVLFLLSDSSDWITGESLNIDGGSLAG